MAVARGSGGLGDEVNAAPQLSGVMIDVADFDDDMVHGIDETNDSNDEEEVFATNTSGGGTSGEDEFEMLVAQLEAVMMDPAFNERVGDFMRAHCAEFDEGEENKLCYMQLFEQYTSMLETYIEAELGALAGPDFDMRAFCATLGSRTDAVASLDLDTLGAFGDFEAFKGMMLACKRGEMLRDEAGGAPFQIVGATMEVHADEQEDGVEMPDLNLSISSAPTLS